MGKKRLRNSQQPAVRKSGARQTLLVSVLVVVSGAIGWLVYTNRQTEAPTAPTPAPTPVSAVSDFQPTVPNTATPPGDLPDGMAWIPGGEFSMGAQESFAHRSRLELARSIDRYCRWGFPLVFAAASAVIFLR